MSKFKVGDVVRVKKDLKINNKYGNCLFIDDMKKYRGLYTTIKSVCTENDGNYLLELSDKYWFDDEMLESNGIIIEYDKKLHCYFAVHGEDTLCFRNFGMSCLSENDEYSEEIGKALAYKRFMECKYKE